MVTFARARPAAPGTALRLGDKFRCLPLDEGLLQPRQNRSGFGQGKSQRVRPQISPLQARHFERF